MMLKEFCCSWRADNLFRRRFVSSVQFWTGRPYVYVGYTADPQHNGGMNYNMVRTLFTLCCGVPATDGLRPASQLPLLPC